VGLLARGMVCVALLAQAGTAIAQFQPPVQSLQIEAQAAWAWSVEDTSCIQLQGPVKIQADDTVLSAHEAVIWIRLLPGTPLEQRRFEVALVGGASVRQPNGILRSGERLFVDGTVGGPIRLHAALRQGQNRADSDLYRQALGMRPADAQTLRERRMAAQWLLGQMPPPPPPPATQPGGQFRPAYKVVFAAERIESHPAEDGTIAYVLSGNVTLLAKAQRGTHTELQAQRAVLFTPITDIKELGQGLKFASVEEAITSAYLEGDVRVQHTPAPGERRGVERLSANRVFYDFRDDRAVLTDVVLHTVEPRREIPIFVRAGVVRQLARNEYTAEKAQISTSGFATPSYRLGATSTYLYQYEGKDDYTGTQSRFIANNTTLDLWGLPVFYFPRVSGTIAERYPLRNLSVSDSGRFGPGVRTTWGLFETIGKPPPTGLDATFQLDWFSDRGPATGLDAEYSGGFITETTRQPWTYRGDLRSYLVHDKGEDELGRKRLEVDPADDLRGRFFWRHTHFLLDDWQAQLTAGYVSDATFLEEWFEDEFRNGQPQQTSLYVKRQRQSEAMTLLVSGQPNDLVTAGDLQQEQFEVERLPEVGYRRIGDSLLDDQVTFFSANTVSALHYAQSEATLAQQGFRANQSPGLPSLGQTGTTGDTTWRGDFRQEVDWPINVQPIKVVPYVMGRYTTWSESPAGGSTDRISSGAGLRVSTSFWKTDDRIRSELLDINRMRHVIEPELDVFAGAASAGPDENYIYDEPIDAVSDISAVQLALRQRWQTKRGGPGRWRSVDVFSLNVAGNFFSSQPQEEFLQPTDFRGLFFPFAPETSLARDSLNADARWQISDTVALRGDMQENLEDNVLATASGGLAVSHEPRVSYGIGLRYIHPFDSTRLYFNTRYELTRRYTLSVNSSYDFKEGSNVETTVSLIRRFDQFYASISGRVDEFDGDRGIVFNVWPAGLNPSQGLGRAGNFLAGE